jgi:hypothetical protein
MASTAWRMHMHSVLGYPTIVGLLHTVHQYHQFLSSSAMTRLFRSFTTLTPLDYPDAEEFFPLVSYSCTSPTHYLAIII